MARDFALPSDWLNPGPADLLRLGLPAGFLERTVIRDYGASLRVRYAARLDQIHLKLYALVDQGPGRHEADLRRLEPSPRELMAAARWTRTHDPSTAFHEMLDHALRHLGVDDRDLGPQS